MDDYLVKFTPLEPYFFGNEKSLWFGETSQKTNSYFIRSNKMPSQTTILGALRFSLLEKHYNVYDINEENIKKDIESIGEDSFNIEKKIQTFGKIKKISPVFLIDDKGDYFIKTPFDHIIYEDEIRKIKNKKYKAFRKYEEVLSNLGNRYLPLDYSAKAGISDSFLNVNTKEICEDFFKFFIKVGIDKKSEKDGFFKKEYLKLKNGTSFAVFATIDKEMRNRVVYLGQDKSAFSLNFEKVKQDLSIEAISKDLIKYRNDLNEIINISLKCKVAIALSDIYVDKEIYDYCYFVNSQTKEHRTFKTMYKDVNKFIDRYEKSADVIYLLKAGSVFLIKNLKEFQECLKNENCQNIGLNICVFGGYENEGKSL